MMKMYAAMGQDAGMFPGGSEELILNSNCPLVANLVESSNKEAVAKQIYKLCLLSRRQLTPDELNEFLSDSFNMLAELK